MVFWVWKNRRWNVSLRLVFTAWAVVALIIGAASAGSQGSTANSTPQKPVATDGNSSKTTATSSKSTTGTSQPVSSQPTTPATWQTVATFTGDSIGNTQPFTVGDEWRIVWTSAPGKLGPANFVINVQQPENDMPLGVVGNVIGKNGATSYESGAGTYYLGILSDENYSIQVQTKVATLPAQPQRSWKTVLKVSGDSMQATQSFNVNGPWRIVWSSDAGSIGDANFSATIQGASGQGVPDGEFANVMGKDSGVDYEYGSGKFNLNILGDEKYTIEVQQGN